MSNFDKIAEKTVATYLGKIAEKIATPGGGAVSAVVAAEGCSLIAMVANFSTTQTTKIIADRALMSIEKLLELGDQDALAFESVVQAFKGKGDISHASKGAAIIPSEIIKICYEHIDDLEYLSSKGNQNLITDTAISAMLLNSAVQSSELNILINMKNFDDVSLNIKVALDTVPIAAERLQQIGRKIKAGIL